MIEDILQVKELQVDYLEKPVLKNISFNAKVGEFIGIIGPNGAGKSTLLKSIRGLTKITTGEVRVASKLLTKLKEKEKAQVIAYMQQEVNKGFGISAKQMVLAGRYPYLNWWQHESQQDYEIAEKYMKFTGVWQLADKDINFMSGGERQRVLLAKVLAQETKLIFLDEPTASLDLTYQEEIFEQCRNLCQQGKTILIVVHDIKLATKFCSRLILLNKGQIIADGKPKEVITAENLHKAYKMKAAVFKNHVSGLLDIYTYSSAKDCQKGKSVHVISGGGVADNIVRKLYEGNYKISMGVISQGDADAVVGEAFKAQIIKKDCFAQITSETSNKNIELIKAANFTVLCNIFYGNNNLANLKAAFQAKKLIVLEDQKIEERDHTDGKATLLYKQLLEMDKVVVMTTPEFIQCMEQHL